jgi:hypothetical protein
VKSYIQNQHHHHSKHSFKDELRTLFVQHKIKFDERYLWDLLTHFQRLDGGMSFTQACDAKSLRPLRLNLG